MQENLYEYFGREGCGRHSYLRRHVGDLRHSEAPKVLHPKASLGGTENLALSEGQNTLTRRLEYLIPKARMLPLDEVIREGCVADGSASHQRRFQIEELASSPSRKSERRLASHQRRFQLERTASSPRAEASHVLAKVWPKRRQLCSAAWLRAWVGVLKAEGLALALLGETSVLMRPSGMVRASAINRWARTPSSGLRRDLTFGKNHLRQDSYGEDVPASQVKKF